MHKIIIIIIILLISKSLFAQYISQEREVNGFSNFYIGTNNAAEPYIAINPTDPLNAVCSFIGNTCVTLDGLHWSRKFELNSGDPFITFDSIGNIYYTPGTNWNTNFLNVRKSTNKGVSWPFYYNIHTGNCDKPAIVGNQAGGIYSNYLYATWTKFVPFHFSFFGRSTDFGETWSNEVLFITDPAYCIYPAIGPSLSVTGGIVYCGYNYSATSNTDIIKIIKSTDGGITFSSEIEATPQFNLPLSIKNNTISVGSTIQMTADNSYGPNRGNVYIVYTGKGSGIDKADIFFTRSTNYGDNWSPPIKLNDDTTTNDQWMPAMTSDKNGNIFIVWYDSRFDSKNLMTLLYGTASSDGGDTFYPDFPVSTTPFNPSLMAVNNFMGDYISVAASGGTALAAWTDGRNNNFGNYVGYFPDFAMITDPSSINLTENDSTWITIKIPEVKGPFNKNVKFTATLDSLPHNGNIYYSFENSDSISQYPDSISLMVKTENVTDQRVFRISVIGRGTSNGIPVHERKISLFVNTVGITNISNELPFQYKLYQNYPNPFNPSTNIRFDIPKRSMVKLTVYDMLGREVARLVDDDLNAGSYEYKWNAIELSSGIYIYKLQSDLFENSKRMVLVK